MGAHIVGAGVALPDNVVTNDDLAKIMDTSDEWIQKRSGVKQRRIAGKGVGSAELGSHAVLAALDDAGIEPRDVDALVSATMTPDHYAPGNAPLIQQRAGLSDIATFEIRQQCSGFLYGMDMADMLIASERAETVVVVGAEAHRGYMPYGNSMDILLGNSNAEVTEADYATATESRGWSVLFGDAGAALVMAPGTPETGVIGSSLHTNGEHFDLIHVPGPGFVQHPWSSVEDIEAGLHHPHMNGRELFRQAVRAMPESVHAVLAKSPYDLDDVDLVLAHQANQRIIDGVAKELGLDEDRIPSNISEHGNTTAATLPLLYFDVRESRGFSTGELLAFTAFGAGAHWGALLYCTP